MIIRIKNSSSKTAIISYGEKDIKLSSGSSVDLTTDKSDINLTVRPKMNTTYSRNRSHFVVLTEYHFCNQDIVTLNLDYQAKIAQNDAWHMYYRMVDVCGDYDATFSIVPPEKKSTFGIEFIVNILLTILFDGFVILAISAVIGVIFESLKLGFISFFVMAVIVTLYEILEDRVLDKIFNGFFAKRRRKKREMSHFETPLYFDDCNKSDYIKYCFDGAKQ